MKTPAMRYSRPDLTLNFCCSLTLTIPSSLSSMPRVRGWALVSPSASPFMSSRAFMTSGGRMRRVKASRARWITAR